MTNVSHSFHRLCWPKQISALRLNSSPSDTALFESIYSILQSEVLLKLPMRWTCKCHQTKLIYFMGHQHNPSITLAHFDNFWGASQLAFCMLSRIPFRVSFAANREFFSSEECIFFSIFASSVSGSRLFTAPRKYFSFISKNLDPSKSLCVWWQT